MSIKFEKKAIIIIFIIAIFLECIIFNINSFRLFFGEYERCEFDVEDLVLNNLEHISEKKYLIKENASIELKDFNKPIGTIKFDVNVNTETSRYNIYFAYKDATTKTYTLGGLPVIMINSKVEDSKYLTMHLTGNVQDLMIILPNVGNEVEFNNIIINEQIPFDFNIFRFICTVLILYFLYNLFLSKSFNSILNKNKMNSIIMIAIIIFSIIIILFGLVNSSNHSILLYETDNLSYEQIYVKSLMEGKLYLNLEVPEKLLNMENPYDHFTRAQEVPEALYDIAFYDGKYYSYFSIIPIITIFLPIYAITGLFINVLYVNIFYAILGAIFSVLLLREIILKWFSNISIKMFCFAILTLLFGNVMLYNVGTPLVYETVQLLGYYLVMQGLYLLFIGLNNKIKYRYIVAGSISLALAVNARPNLVFVSVFVLPILIKVLIDLSKNKDKANIIKYCLSICIPYIVIGILIMLFNYIRFDNIFEFGARYQLTSNDMMALGYRFETLFLGVWNILFNPVSFSADFPYFFAEAIKPQFLGFFGYAGAGLFGMTPILYILVLLPIFKNSIKQKDNNLWKLVAWSLISALIMVMAIILVAASYIRYQLDFAWMFLIPAILLMLVIYEEIKNNNMIKKSYEVIIGIFIVLGIILNMSVGIVSEQKIGYKYNSELFDTLRSKISFWE